MPKKIKSGVLLFIFASGLVFALMFFYTYFSGDRFGKDGAILAAFAAICLTASSTIFLLDRKANQSYEKFEYILIKCDPKEIEIIRNAVFPEHLPWFAKRFDSLSNWTKKMAIVLMVQDIPSSILSPMMMDILRAPLGDSDAAREVRAIALSHLEGDLNLFIKYFQDEVAAEEAASRYVGTSFE